MVNPDVPADSKAICVLAPTVYCVWMARVGYNTRVVEIPAERPFGAAVEEAIHRYIVCEGVHPHHMQIVIPPDDDYTPTGTV